MALERWFITPAPGDSKKWQFKMKDGNAIIEGKKSYVMGLAIKAMRKHGGSLRIMKANGQFQEERTYPRSADPKRSKG